MVAMIGIMVNSIHPKITLFRNGANMNEYEEKSEYEFLYEVLDKFDTPKVKLYYLACLETGDEDGMRISNIILNSRGASYETA